uniref:Uncharacterized protein n=1 Tax=Panagrolaimus sp. ES5 TaxID=591445 RepID=A0AC34FLM3_9BILA
MELQTQLTQILFIQALIPFLTSVIPMLLNVVGTMFNSSAMAYLDIPVWVLTVWGSAINPICTMLLMGSYRKVILQFFLRTKRLNSVVGMSEIKNNNTITNVKM